MFPIIPSEKAAYGAAGTYSGTGCWESLFPAQPVARAMMQDKSNILIFIILL
jgi:hypothetical protein